MRTRIAALFLLASLAAAAQVQPTSVIGVNTTQAASTLTASCSTGLSCTSSSTAIIPLAGQQTANIVVTASTSPVGLNAVVDCTKDSSATPVWILSGTPAASGLVGLQLNNTITSVVNNPVAGSSYTLVPTPECKGALSYRFRIAGLTSVTTFSVQPHSVAGALGDVSYIGGKLFAQGARPADSSISCVNSSEQTAAPLSQLPAAGTLQQQQTFTATTTETTLIAGVSGLFYDVTQLHCTNSSAIGTVFELRDATAGTLRDSWWLAPGGGFAAPINPSSPFRQSATGGNWTGKTVTSVSSAFCTIQVVQR